MFNYKNVYIEEWFSIVGPKAKETNLKKYNLSINDYYFNESTFEKAEVKMQKVILNYFNRNSKPSVLVASDLMDQMTSSAIGAKNVSIPYLGLYNACASSVSGLITIANMLSFKNIKDGLFITSSHNLTAGKQFRFPTEYGAPVPKRSTITATGAIGIKLTKKETKYKIVSSTLGMVTDSYVKDAYNMGAVMAPSAVRTIIDHLKNQNKSPEDYDLVLTGDLGEVGKKIFLELLKKENIKLKNYEDAGANFYQKNEASGASGPAVLPLYFFNNTIYNKKYKRILLLATGSLHSPLLVNQKESIPAVTHAIEIEVSKWL